MASQMLEVVNMGEMTERIATSRATVRAWCEEGMPHFRVGESENAEYRFVWAWALEWLVQREIVDGDAMEEV